MKICSKCRSEKIASSFSRDARKNDGLRIYCRLCDNKKTSEWFSLHPFYSCWKHMLDRCYNKKCSKYFDYGARGVHVCESWRYSYDAFRDWCLIAIEKRMAKGDVSDRKTLSLDKDINGSGSLCYGPEFCCFATPSEQSFYRRKQQSGSLLPQSIYNGVSWNDKLGKWLARQTINGKKTHLGYFVSDTDANTAVIEFSKTNRALGENINSIQRAK